MNAPANTLFGAALPGIPLIEPGDDLAQIVAAALDNAGYTLQTGDALVVSSKIVSKSEGRIVDLSSVQAGDEAHRLAGVTHKDPRIVQLILSESRVVSRAAVGVLVTEHRLGFVSANAGIDQSNVGGGPDQVLLLPLDPDASARRLAGDLQRLTGVKPAVVISDTHGRPFRMGNVGVAIGLANMPALIDQRGEYDLFGRELLATVQGYGDLVASAAHLLCGEAAEGLPVVLLRGLQFPSVEGCARDLNRPPDRDLYR